jgi:DNA repair exonuclease SbcCD ATPase subunit
MQPIKGRLPFSRKGGLIVPTPQEVILSLHDKRNELLRDIAALEAKLKAAEEKLAKNCLDVGEGHGVCDMCANGKPELCRYVNTVGALKVITTLESKLKAAEQKLTDLETERIKLKTIGAEYWQTLCHYDHDDISTPWPYSTGGNRQSSAIEQVADLESERDDLLKALNETGKLLDDTQTKLKAAEDHAKELEAQVEEKANKIWHKGRPNHVYGSEWFIAVTVWGDKVVLKELPEEHSYDYKTADETYIKKDKIKKWMQFPNSGFIPYCTTPDNCPIIPKADSTLAEKELQDCETCPDREACKLGDQAFLCGRPR